LKSEGKIDDAARAFFLSGVQDGVESTGSGLVAANTVAAAMKERPDLARCEDDRCLLSLARATQAQAVVLAQVTKETVRGERERSKYKVRLRLYDAESADFTSVEEEGCTRCTEPELQALLRAVTKRLIERERHPETAPLEVFSTPPEAEVRIDGRLLGLSPLNQSVAVGAHHLAVEKRGLQAAAADVTLEAGKTWRVTVTWDPAGAAKVEQGPPPPPVAVAPPPTPAPVLILPPPIAPWYRRADGFVGAGLLVLTVGEVATGIALLAINGNPADCLAPPHDGQHCPSRYSTLGGGIASLVIAAVTGTAGALLIDGRILHRRRVGATAQIAPDHLGAALYGQFQELPCASPASPWSPSPSHSGAGSRSPRSPRRAVPRSRTTIPKPSGSGPTTAAGTSAAARRRRSRTSSTASSAARGSATPKARARR
jgi:hypothetical protein